MVYIDFFTRERATVSEKGQRNIGGTVLVRTNALVVVVSDDGIERHYKPLRMQNPAMMAASKVVQRAHV